MPRWLFVTQAAYPRHLLASEPPIILDQPNRDPCREGLAYAILGSLASLDPSM